MKEIPDFQKMAPAGHGDRIAFRPACAQLDSQLVSKKVEWFVTLPTGEKYILATRQAEPIENAHAGLDASGICKVNGAIVPIVPPNQAIASSRQVVDNRPMTDSGIPIIAIIGVLSAIAIAVIAILLTRKDKDLQAFVGEE